MLDSLRTLLVALPLLAAGCAPMPLKEAGTLTTYENLGKSDGLVSKARRYVDATSVASAKTVGILPTVFTPSAASRVAEPGNRDLVANALDRAMCVALSDKFRIVAPGEGPDLTVQAAVTDVLPTHKAAAGVATAVTLGSSVVLPVSVPRLPVGLGGLAVEVEAVDRAGVQRAAMVWARGANSIMDNPRVSEVGDAYAMATKLGDEFAHMLLLGRQPRMLDVSLPSGQRVQSWLGGAPKHAACDAFGRAPGLLGVVATKFGAPPEWTDKGATTAAEKPPVPTVARSP